MQDRPGLPRRQRAHQRTGRGWRPPAVHRVRQRGRRQVHVDRPAAARDAFHPRRPDGRADRGTAAGTAPRAATWISRCWSNGLEAEREQAITIDVAYRFFSSCGRRFIVADTPGHEQYTRNMATGASTADLAIVLVDASKGLLTQTRAALPDHQPDGDPPHRAGGQQDRPDRLRPGPVRGNSRGVRAGSGRLRLCHAGGHPTGRPLRRQRDRAQHPHALVQRPYPSAPSGDGKARRSRGASVPHAGAMGQPA